jgi:Transglutaminase-like superfamily
MGPLLRALGLLLTLTATAGAQRSLLVDGDFESGDKGSPAWVPIQPPGFDASFSFPADGAFAGRRCGRIGVTEQGGYTSFTQKIELSRRYDWLRLSAFARVHQQSGAGGAWLVLTFLDKAGGDAGLARSLRLDTPGEWEELSVEVTVPKGATHVLARCGVSGPARASFDDVKLVAGSGGGAREDATLLEVHGHWTVTATQAVGEPWVDVSVPFPFAAQTPLALRVDAEPAEAVARLSGLADRENRLLRLTLAPLEAGAEVRLHVRTLVLVRGRELPDGRGAEIVPAERVPEALREHLQPAAGIESGDERVVAIAGGFDRADLAQVAASLFRFLEREIKSGSGDQGALATLESGDAACTGHANLGAALLIAAGLPTRVLACVLVGSDQQEHYVVESWTKDTGWARLEPTLRRFPVPDDLHAILRVVYGDSPRSSGHVPLFWDSADGLAFGPDTRRLREKNCWQSAQEAARLAPERSAVAALEAAARQVFEVLTRTPHEGARIRLAPDEGPASILGAIDAFLEP